MQNNIIHSPKEDLRSSLSKNSIYELIFSLEQYKVFLRIAIPLMSIFFNLLIFGFVRVYVPLLEVVVGCTIFLVLVGIFYGLNHYIDEVFFHLKSFLYRSKVISFIFFFLYSSLLFFGIASIIQREAKFLQGGLAEYALWGFVLIVSIICGSYSTPFFIRQHARETIHRLKKSEYRSLRIKELPPTNVVKFIGSIVLYFIFCFVGALILIGTIFLFIR